MVVVAVWRKGGGRRKRPQTELVEGGQERKACSMIVPYTSVPLVRYLISN